MRAEFKRKVLGLLDDGFGSEGFLGSCSDPIGCKLSVRLGDGGS